MRDDLTELERCVLGVVWRDGPMTAYEVAVTFATSVSTYWSGSAGAIYPLVKRLTRRGLLRVHKRETRRTLLTATPAGVASLRSWLTPPLPTAAAAPSFDPVRTRLYFVDVLPPAQRPLFLAEAVRATRQQLQFVRAQRERDSAAGRDSEAIGHLGVEYELRARLRWLAEVRRLMAKRKKR